nr:AtpZ/AtpI family protein [uncultured Capnocytophaga sp.]
MKNSLKHNQSPKKQLNNWIYFSQAGLQMAATIAICTYLGVWLDQQYPNKHSLFTIGCALFGVFAALYTIIRKALKMNKDEA